MFLLSVPIEAVLAGADVRATAGMYEEKSNQTAVIFLLYNFVTLGLLGTVRRFMTKTCCFNLCLLSVPVRLGKVIVSVYMRVFLYCLC